MTALRPATVFIVVAIKELKVLQEPGVFCPSHSETTPCGPLWPLRLVVSSDFNPSWVRPPPPPRPFSPREALSMPRLTPPSPSPRLFTPVSSPPYLLARSFYHQPEADAHTLTTSRIHEGIFAPVDVAETGQRPARMTFLVNRNGPARGKSLGRATGAGIYS